MAKCVNGFELQVLKSPAGYYIGTLTEEGLPGCRVSVIYYKKKEDADRALADSSYTVRDCIENNYCSKGRGCILA